jgi:hypothetical protein
MGCSDDAAMIQRIFSVDAAFFLKDAASMLGLLLSSVSRIFESLPLVSLSEVDPFSWQASWPI